LNHTWSLRTAESGTAESATGGEDLVVDLTIFPILLEPKMMNDIWRKKWWQIGDRGGLE